jgi:outer membrane protein
MRKLLTAAVLLFAMSAVWSQQEITRIGLVDTTKIYSVYYEDSKALRDLKQFQDSVREESTAIQDEITALQSRRLDAERQGRNAEAIRLEGEILAKENFLREYQRVKRLEWERLLSKTEKESAFLAEVADAIAFVAISEGFTIVMDLDNSMFMYYSVEADMTDKVLEHLFEQAGKTYSPNN